MIDPSTSATDHPTIVCPLCGTPSLEPYEDALDVEGHEIKIHICLVCSALVNQRELERALSTTETENEIQMTSPGVDSYCDLEQNIAMYQQILRFLLRSLPSVNPAQSVFAEIGIGQGAFIRAAASSFKKGYAVDCDFSVFEAASARLEVPTGISFLKSMEHIDDPVDVVACWRSLERMPRLFDVISQVRSVLRPGGYLCFKVPLYRPEHLLKGIQTLFNYRAVTVVAELQEFDLVDISTDHSSARLLAILRRPDSNKSRRRC